MHWLHAINIHGTVIYSLNFFQIIYLLENDLKVRSIYVIIPYPNSLTASPYPMDVTLSYSFTAQKTLIHIVFTSLKITHSCNEETARFDIIIIIVIFAILRI